MLGRLVPDIRKTAELVQEVSAASREQSTGIEQTNKALHDLDRVTQQNASAAEQMAATSAELSSQAQQLQTAVSFFRIGDNARGAPLPIRAPRSVSSRLPVLGARPAAAQASGTRPGTTRAATRHSPIAALTAGGNHANRGVDLDLDGTPGDDESLFERS
jgi:methyl-accepting chemotaxis protein